MNARAVGLLLISLSFVTAAGVAAYNNQQRQIPIIFSDSEALRAVWANYKKSGLEPNTYRTLDKQRENITTSEGQAYTMLRSVWMDDQQTFDRSWQWTQNNLKRPSDNLSSWLFGQRTDGSYGVVTEKGGENSATDGDTDLAMSLLMAHGRWNRPEYLESALAIISDIWEYDVVMVAGKPVLTATDLERNSTTTLVINPSYFSPAAYRLFAEVDAEHDWRGLASNSYALLNESTRSNLDTTARGKLPPNWMLMNRSDGSLQATSDPQLTSQYGYDAMRIPWRIALDYSWHQNSDAYDYLRSLTFLSDKWESEKALATVYNHDGSVAVPEESVAMYGASIGYFMVADHAHFKEVYDTKLAVLYSSDKDGWAEPDHIGYYDDNFAWFGIALATGQLPNLTEL